MTMPPSTLLDNALNERFELTSTGMRAIPGGVRLHGTGR